MKLRIGFNPFDLFRFIFWFFYYFILENWGRLIVLSLLILCLYFSFTIPKYVSDVYKIEFEMLDDKGDIHYFIKKSTGINGSDFLSVDKLGGVFSKRENSILYTHFNDLKILSFFLLGIMILVQFVLLLEEGWSDYLNFNKSQRLSMVKISTVDVDDDGLYNCIVFGRTYYKLYYNDGISYSIAPTILELRHLKPFINKSINRDKKLSDIGI